MRETAKVMFVAYVAYPTKVVAQHVKYQATIVPLVSVQYVHLYSPSPTVTQYGANAATFFICTVS